jgi:hypothetical protein
MRLVLLVGACSPGIEGGGGAPPEEDEAPLDVIYGYSSEDDIFYGGVMSDVISSCGCDDVIHGDEDADEPEAPSSDCR